MQWVLLRWTDGMGLVLSVDVACHSNVFYWLQGMQQGQFCCNNCSSTRGLCTCSTDLLTKFGVIDQRSSVHAARPTVHVTASVSLSCLLNTMRLKAHLPHTQLSKNKTGYNSKQAAMQTVSIIIGHHQTDFPVPLLPPLRPHVISCAVSAHYDRKYEIQLAAAGSRSDITQVL